MKYTNIVRGTFIERKNRFLGYVRIGEEIVPCHIPNTSRLEELCVKGYPCVLVEHDQPHRKTRYTLVHIQKGDRWVQIDSQAPNTIVYEALCADPSRLSLPEDTKFFREKTFQSSRFDLYYENHRERGFVEVKGVTLENEGIAYFPGAPTKRGVKHLMSLWKARQCGYGAHVLFLVQIEQVRGFKPNAALDPEFADALACVYRQGVSVHVWGTKVSPDEVTVDRSIKWLKHED